MKPIRLYKYRWYFRIGWLVTLLVLKTIDYYFFDCSYSFPRLAMVILFVLSLPIIALEDRDYTIYNYSIGLEWFNYIVIGITITIVLYFSLDMAWPEKPYKGASIIRPANIEERRRVGRTQSLYYKISFADGDSVRHDGVTPKKETDRLTITYRLECKEKLCQYPYGFYSNQELDDSLDTYLSYLNQVHDFAFLQGKTFYTYYDFSMESPCFVYEVVGYNILYKAKPKVKNDSILLLSFSDISGKTNTLSKILTDSLNIPEYYCVFRNINPKYDKGWVIAAPEVNTPENWAKISDYGYIFHYDVYSKEEIENQCSEIRNYVENYKERMGEK